MAWGIEKNNVSKKWNCVICYKAWSKSALWKTIFGLLSDGNWHSYCRHVQLSSFRKRI